MREDEREERELRSYAAHSLANDMMSSMPGTANGQRPDEVKHPVTSPQQQDEAMQWSQHSTDQSGRR